MNRNLALALAASLGTLGYVAGSAQTATAAAPAPKVELINVKLVRGERRVSLPDGGTATQATWLARACGYATGADAGRVGEPCWDDFIEPALFAPVEAALLTER